MPRQGDGPRNRIRAKWFLCVLLSQPNILCEDEGEGKGNFLSWKWIESLNPKRPELQIETTIEFLLKLLDSSSCQEKYQQDYEKISESAKNIFFSGDRKKDNLKSFLRDYLEKKISILKDVKTGPGIKKWIFTVVTWSRADVETNLIGLANSWETKASVDPIDSTKVISYSSLTPHNLPYSGAVKFIGRDKFLKNLHDAVQTDKLGAITAIKGMGGVGKTELAIQYCLQHLNTYTGGVCWVNARGEDAADIQSKVASDVIQFAISDLGLEPPLNRNITLLTQLRFCWKNWPFSNTPVLVVLDDVNNYAALKDFLPKYPRFKVLLTTRLQLGMSLNTLQLDVLKSRQAFKLLRILVDRQNDQIRIRNELWIAKKIIKWLGCLPLGIELVGRYLERNQDLSLSEMLQRLELERLKQPAFQKPDIEEDMTAQLGVKAAFSLSWKELDENAQKVASLLGLFAYAPIPWSLVKLSVSDEDLGSLDSIRDQQLIYFSLLKRVRKDTYQLHQLIREFFIDELNESKWSADLKRGCCRAISKTATQLPSFVTQNHYEVWELIKPHLAEAAFNLTPWLSNQDLIAPFCALGNYYKSQGMYDQAIFWQEKCLVLVRERLEENHPDTLISLNKLAILYQDQCRYSKAEMLFIQALDISRHLLGGESSNVAATFNNLALLYQRQGRYKEAEAFYDRALKLYNQLEEYLHAATSLNNLGSFYQDIGRYMEAEKLYRNSLQIRRNLSEEAHPDVAQSIHNLALVCMYQGHYDEAEQFFKESLSLYVSLFGEDNLDVAIAASDLAVLYQKQGRYSEAEYCHQKVLMLRIRLLGEEHLDVANSLSNLALVYQIKGHYSDAEKAYRSALEIRVKLLEKEHPSILSNLNNLAVIHQKQGHYGKAESMFLEALDLNLKLFGEDHPSVATNLNNLAVIYLAQRRYEEAEILLEKATNLSKKEHPDTLICLSNLADLYRVQKNYVKAETIYKNILKVRINLLGEEHLDIANALNNLAGNYQVQERFTEAEPLYLRALNICENLFGERHPSVAFTLNNLARLYHSQKRYLNAEELYKRAISVHVSLFGENCSDVISNLVKLAELYQIQGRYREAIALQGKVLEIRNRSLGKGAPQN